MNHRAPRRHAFSLVELSIVLVILGLLTGGILTGQSLIRAAELRSETAQLSSFQTAVYNFRDKYFALPGDFPKAHQFWGSAGGSGVLGDGCQSATGTGTQTCSGNGDGNIIIGGVNQYSELFTFWQHLANAGLIEGSYTGKSGTAGTADHNFGENAPVSKLSNIGWGASWVNNDIPSPLGPVWKLNYNNWMTIGGDDGVWADATPGTMLAEEVWNIDTKMDDGIPGTGKIHLYGVNACTDTGDNTLYKTSKYKLDYTTKNCSITFDYLGKGN